MPRSKILQAISSRGEGLQKLHGRFAETPRKLEWRNVPCRRCCATSSQPKLRGSSSFRLHRDGEESYPGTSAAAPAPAPAPSSSGGGGDAVAAAAATESHIAVIEAVMQQRRRKSNKLSACTENCISDYNCTSGSRS